MGHYGGQMRIVMVEKWQKISGEALGDYRIFRLWQETHQSPRTGKRHRFFVLDAPDWINVIPLTADGNVVMIHQFRVGSGEITLELPGGMVEAVDGDAGISAERELREETGYAGDRAIKIGHVAPNPAFLNNLCHTYLVPNAHRVGPPQFDGAEDIATEEVALATIPDLIATQRITHALTIAAFYHLQTYQRLNAA
jgi:8-oxo-dGTP pyrophosphatase MutT (NUDIX family)